MIRWTLTFLVIALLAAVFGFTGIGATAAPIARAIFHIFLCVLRDRFDYWGNQEIRSLIQTGSNTGGKV